MWVTPGDGTDTPGTSVWANEMWRAECDLLDEVYRIFGFGLVFFFLLLYRMYFCYFLLFGLELQQVFITVEHFEQL